METPSLHSSLQEASVLIKLIGNLPDSIYVKDADGRYVMDNPAHRRVLGIAEESDVVGKTVYDFFPQSLAERYHKDDEEVIRTGQQLLNREETMIDAAGQKRWMRTSKIPLHDAAGKVTGLICIGRDITQRRQAEEALAVERDLLRTVIDNLPSYIYVKDTQGRFVLNNQAHLQALGAKSQQEVSGKSDLDFFAREMAERYFADEQKVIQSGEPMLAHEQPRIDHAGATRWVVASKVPWRNSRGEIIGTLGISSDITDRKIAEERVKQYAHELEADLTMAREMQQSLLPQQYPVFSVSGRPDSTLRFCHRYHPCKEVGGDFFDVIALSPTKAGVFICDVMGKGVRAALVTAMVRTLVEELTPLAHEPGRFLTAINRGLVGTLRPTKMPIFASAFYIVADVENGELHFANAGHPRAFHLRRDRQVVEAIGRNGDHTGPALGLFEDSGYTTGRRELAARDLLMLYTDGLFEVFGANQEEYGQERLCAAVERRMQLSQENLFDELLEEIHGFSSSEELPDDVCMVGVEAT
jgi:sigma-B regulation protein RsbU (phosphoserine phosphatase)